MEEKIITQKEIHEKGFNIVQDYSKLKFGPKTYDDATVDFPVYEKLKRKNYH